jgi:hypothetical protein
VAKNKPSIVPWESWLSPQIFPKNIFIRLFIFWWHCGLNLCRSAIAVVRFGVEFNSGVLPELKNNSFMGLLLPHIPSTSTERY